MAKKKQIFGELLGNPKAFLKLSGIYFLLSLWGIRGADDTPIALHHMEDLQPLLREVKKEFIESMHAIEKLPLMFCRATWKWSPRIKSVNPDRLLALYEIMEKGLIPLAWEDFKKFKRSAIVLKEGQPTKPPLLRFKKGNLIATYLTEGFQEQWALFALEDALPHCILSKELTSLLSNWASQASKFLLPLLGGGGPWDGYMASLVGDFIAALVPIGILFPYVSALQKKEINFEDFHYTIASCWLIYLENKYTPFPLKITQLGLFLHATYLFYKSFHPPKQSLFHQLVIKDCALQVAYIDFLTQKIHSHIMKHKIIQEAGFPKEIATRLIDFSETFHWRFKDNKKRMTSAFNHHTQEWQEKDLYKNLEETIDHQNFFIDYLKRKILLLFSFLFGLTSLWTFLLSIWVYIAP